MSIGLIQNRLGSGEIYVGNEEACLHLNFSSGILVTVFNSGTAEGAAIYLDSSVQDSKDLQRYVKMLLDAAKLSPNDRYELKVIGSKSQLSVAESAVRILGKKVTSSVARDGKVEVLFYPSSGRVRVSKEEKIKVLVVDDSKTIIQLLCKIFATDPAIEVVATAERPSLVEDLIVKYKPDVLTLDIHMPEMTGVELIKRLMPRFRIPAVMVSSVSMEESPLVLEALESGAVDYIQKPSMKDVASVGAEIIEKVKNAVRANVSARTVASARSVSHEFGSLIDQSQIVAIGSSTGGTEALRQVLTALPENIPPILIVQHIPAVFSLAFANRMNDLCPFHVKEAVDGDAVVAGQVLIAPGGFQMSLKKSASGFVVKVEDAAPVNRHKPSVDVLFNSVAELVKDRAIGVILTGMGADGAKGLLKMKQAGARTIAQSEASCVVFGMPREAIRLGAAQSVHDLSVIPQEVVKLLGKRKAA